MPIDLTTRTIAHDVAVESEMAHESLSALTAVIQEGIDRTMAALPIEIAVRRVRQSLSYGSDTESRDAGRLLDRIFPEASLAPLSAGEPDGMETTADKRAIWLRWLSDEDASPIHGFDLPRCEAAMLLRDFDRLLNACRGAVSRRDKAEQALGKSTEWWMQECAAREAKARKEEREACAVLADEQRDSGLNADLQNEPILWCDGYEHGCRDTAIAIRARSKP